MAYAFFAWVYGSGDLSAVRWLAKERGADPAAK